MSDNTVNWHTDLTFDESEAFDTTYSSVESFGTSMDSIVEIVISDHTKLLNLDADNQHPINAIKNLNTELTNRVVAGNALTNLEIEELLGD